MKVQKLRNVKTPNRGTEASAGIDFYVPEDFETTILKSGESILIPSGIKVHFLDNEAFFLHKNHYLKWVSELFDFPIDYDNPDIFKYITEDPNKKYIKYVDKHWLDDQVWHGVQSKNKR